MRTLARVRGPSVESAIDAYRELTRRRVEDGVRSVATLEMLDAHKRWWMSTVGDRPLDQLTGPFLAELVAELPRMGPQRAGGRCAGPETLRKRLSTLRGALVLAHQRGWIPALPPLPQVLAPWRPRRRILETPADARRLYESLPEHRARWFWLCLWSAQHASDVERMSWADVQLGNQPEFLRRNTKNGVTPRWVVCPEPLAVELRRWKRADRPAQDARIVLRWPSRNHTLPRHCRRLGLTEMNAIDLRHTCLSWAVAELGLVPAVAEYAGHSSLTMLSRTYAQCVRHHLPEVAQALSGLASREPCTVQSPRPPERKGGARQ